MFRSPRVSVKVPVGITLGITTRMQEDYLDKEDIVNPDIEYIERKKKEQYEREIEVIGSSVFVNSKNDGSDHIPDSEYVGDELIDFIMSVGSFNFFSPSPTFALELKKYINGNKPINSIKYIVEYLENDKDFTHSLAIAKSYEYKRGWARVVVGIKFEAGFNIIVYEVPSNADTIDTLTGEDLLKAYYATLTAILEEDTFTHYNLIPENVYVDDKTIYMVRFRYAMGDNNGYWEGLENVILPRWSFPLRDAWTLLRKLKRIEDYVVEDLIYYFTQFPDEITILPYNKITSKFKVFTSYLALVKSKIGEDSDKYRNNPKWKKVKMVKSKDIPTVMSIYQFADKIYCLLDEKMVKFYRNSVVDLLNSGRKEMIIEGTELVTVDYEYIRSKLEDPTVQWLFKTRPDSPCGWWWNGFSILYFTLWVNVLSYQ